MNLKNPLPSPSKRFVWHYNRANEKAIYDSCKNFDWRQQLITIQAENAVGFFNETLINICKNFIPHEDKLIRPSDPPWITKSCRNFYCKYKRKFNRFTKRGCPPEQKAYLDRLKNDYSDLVLAEKEKYLKRLRDEVSNPLDRTKKSTGAP